MASWPYPATHILKALREFLVIDDVEDDADGADQVELSRNWQLRLGYVSMDKGVVRKKVFEFLDAVGGDVEAGDVGCTRLNEQLDEIAQAGADVQYRFAIQCDHCLCQSSLQVEPGHLIHHDVVLDRKLTMAGPT
jgi:hypothetical protein